MTSVFFKWAVIAGIAWSGAFSMPAQADERHAGSALGAPMEEALQEEGLVGVVWTVVTPGATTTGADGLADARSGVALSSDAKVQTGSIAKTLIAVAILRLVTENRLALDSPVASLLPQLAFDNPWAAQQPVRVRHLLDHTSGLDDARLSQIFSLEAEPDTLLQTGVERGSLRIRSRPGSRFSYSNQGYTVLGMVIERVTGERYERYLDAHLLRPLGMYQSTFGYVSQQGAHADPQLAMGHFERGVAQVAVPWFLRPAAQFTTTAADMGRLAQFLMGNGDIAGQPFVAPQLLRAMGRPTTTEAVSAGLTGAGYGLGLNTRDRYGVIGHCHHGNTVGFRANLCLFPAAQKAFFVAMNADVETANYRRFDALLVRALGMAAATPAQVAAPRHASGARPSEATEHPLGGQRAQVSVGAFHLGDWQGVYVLAPSRMERFAYLDRVLNFATLRWDGRQLHLTPFQGKTETLLPVGGRLLRGADRTAASHVLLISDQGRRSVSDGLRSYDQISLWRMVPLWVSLAAGLIGGLYLLAVGMVRLLRRRLGVAQPLFMPFVAVVALALPAPLFYGQSFLQLGDLTPASALLALVTGALPLAMLFGLWRGLSLRATGRRAWADTLAMLGVLQWCLVLACWGLLPLRLWA